MSPIIMVLIFIASTIAGYKLIKNVPSLLHTPLMSGMNALSGITVLGALVATGIAAAAGNRFIGAVAVVLATVNIVAGFGVTHRMLKMFDRKGGGK